jgi:hypothetical protein
VSGSRLIRRPLVPEPRRSHPAAASSAARKSRAWSMNNSTEALKRAASQVWPAAAAPVLSSGLRTGLRHHALSQRRWHGARTQLGYPRPMAMAGRGSSYLEEYEAAAPPAAPKVVRRNEDSRALLRRGVVLPGRRRA